MKRLFEQQPHKRIWDNTSHGFLLLQLQIALVLIVVLAAFSLPQSSFMHRWYLNAELEKLYALFHCAHQKALTMHHDVAIEFDTATRSYRCGKIKEQLPQGIMFGAPDRAKGPPGNAKDYIKQPITFQAQKAICYADGTISAGSVYLTDVQKNLCYALSIGVSQAPFVRTYRLATTWVPLV